MRLRRRTALHGLLGIALPGCAAIGPGRLGRDQFDYTQAVADSSKRQTLFNIVRLRFGNAPAFVTVNQLVNSYSLQRSGSATFEAFPSAAASSFWGLTGGLQYTDTPTFTLQPLTGQAFVQAYLRPFAPNEIVPMVSGGVPVDVLFRLVLQSVGPLQNTHPMALGARGGSAEVLPVLGLLRELQVAGVMRSLTRKTKEGERAFLIFDTSHAPRFAPVVADVYRRLGIDPKAREVEVVYGGTGQQLPAPAIPVLTRPLLSVLASIAAEMDVAAEDVAAGRTPETLREPGAPRPVLEISSGPEAPADAYWIEDGDFRSKLAFTIIELLKSVAESSQGQANPVLTIPAR
jgi:hypothetical protein